MGAPICSQQLFAEIDASILRKERTVAQFGHATGELHQKLGVNLKLRAVIIS